MGFCVLLAEMDVRRSERSRCGAGVQSSEILSFMSLFGLGILQHSILGHSILVLSILGALLFRPSRNFFNNIQTNVLVNGTMIRIFFTRSI